MRDIKLLLVEESSASRKLMSAYLGHAGFEVDEAADLDDARDRIALTRPDMAIVALETGVEAPDFLRELDQGGVEILVLSSSNRVQDRITALEQGALDVMTKPLEFRELVLRIQRVMRARSRRSLPSSMEIDCGGATLDIASRVLRGSSTRPILLTPSEFRLIYLLLRSNGRIVERASISRNVLGHAESNTSRSVDVMVSKLRRKLGASGSGCFIRNVRSEGYVLVSEQRERARNPALSLDAAGPVLAHGT